LHNPPGDGNALKPLPGSTQEEKREEVVTEVELPKTNPWVCLFFMVITVAIMAFTAQWVSYFYHEYGTFKNSQVLSLAG
jgi:Ca2+:H+ antiporter